MGNQRDDMTWWAIMIRCLLLLFTVFWWYFAVVGFIGCCLSKMD